MLACFDLETHLIRPGEMFPRLVLGAVRLEGEAPVVLAREDMLDRIEQLLADPAVEFVNHSIGFDFGVVLRHRPWLAGAVFAAYRDLRVICTHMLTQLHDIAVYGKNSGGLTRVVAAAAPVDRVFLRHADDDDTKSPLVKYVKLPKGYSLKDQAKRWLGVDLLKDETRITYSEYDGVPVSELPARQIEYVSADTCALDLAIRIGPVANAREQAARDFALRLTEASGRYVDPDQVRRMRRRFSHSVAGHFKTLTESRILEAQTCAMPRYPFARVEIARKPKRAKTIMRLMGIEPRKAYCESSELVRHYMQFKTPGEVPRRWRRLLLRSGMWARSTSSVFGEPERTGDYVMKQGPLQELYETHAGRVPLERTPTGQVKNVEQNAIRTKDPVLLAAVEYSRADRILKDLDKYEAGVKTPVNVRVNGMAETGRTTSGGGESRLNDQNYRREYGFRECFIPRKGCVFASIDFSQIELCSLAQVQYAWFGRSALGDAINARRDCHVVFAAMLLGLTYDEAAAKKKQGDKQLKEYRQLAKAFGFGRPGGLAELKFIEWASAAYGVEIPFSEWGTAQAPGFVEIPEEHQPGTVWVHRLPPELQEQAQRARGRDGKPLQYHYDGDPDGWLRISARWLRNLTGKVYAKENTYAHLNSRFLQTFPELLEYHSKIKDMVKAQSGTIVQEQSGRVRAGCRFTQAANSFFQGLTADGATAALFDVWDACFDPSSPLYRCRVVWFVHDEIGLEAQEEKLTDACEEASRLMVAAMKRFTPDVFIEAQPAACRRWTKAADEPRYCDGKLVPEEDWRLATGWYDATIAKLAEAVRGGDRGKVAYLVDVCRERADVIRHFRRYGIPLPKGGAA